MGSVLGGGGFGPSVYSHFVGFRLTPWSAVPRGTGRGPLQSRSGACAMPWHADALSSPLARQSVPTRDLRCARGHAQAPRVFQFFKCFFHLFFGRWGFLTKLKNSLVFGGKGGRGGGGGRLLPSLPPSSLPPPLNWCRRQHVPPWASG